MKRNLAGLLGLALLTLSPAQALERPDKEFAIFQFPPTMIPRIDGQTDSNVPSRSIRPHRTGALPVDVFVFANGVFVYINAQARSVAQFEVAILGQIRFVHPVLPLVAQGRDVL